MYFVTSLDVMPRLHWPMNDPPKFWLGFQHEFVNIRSGNTIANIIRLSVEECVHVVINEYRLQELERDNILVHSAQT